MGIKLVVQLSRIVLDILVQKDKVIYIFASQYFGFAASKVDITSVLSSSVFSVPLRFVKED
ncbi:hypothetical protein [Nostoc sp.]|uniref:hypothetical protein n=1 Tax=Nostoc sp. TaxID=1180 RepID=UPI002FF8B710